MGPRGDVILQLDWSVGAILEALERTRLSENTIFIFTSDNGPVVDDGYRDKAVELLGDHKPSGPMRGGKYSAFEAGTRVPFIVRWPAMIRPGTSDALFSQVDLFASFATLVGQSLDEADAPDSFPQLETLVGKDKRGREYVIQQSLHNTLSIVQGQWKYITPSQRAKMNVNTNTELGNDSNPQLYDLKKDPGERNNVASRYPKVVAELEAKLAVVSQNSSRTP